MPDEDQHIASDIFTEEEEVDVGEKLDIHKDEEEPYADDDTEGEGDYLNLAIMREMDPYGEFSEA